MQTEGMPRAGTTLSSLPPELLHELLVYFPAKSQIDCHVSMETIRNLMNILEQKESDITLINLWIKDILSKCLYWRTPGKS